MKLYLDDIRDCPGGWTLARNVEEAKACVRQARVNGEPWEFASLDHDLADVHYAASGYIEPAAPEQTGLAFVDWMIEMDIWPLRKPVVHSMNPVGAARMRAAIDRHWKEPA